MRIRKQILPLFLLISITCFSQEDAFIVGQLVDPVKKETIPFASIKIKGKALGVISNIDGTFKIPLRFKEMGETLVISCMGYLSKEVVIQDLSEEESNVIPLEPGGFELGEAVVSANIRRLSARQIVRIAVNSIPQNYPTDQFEIIGYYRDYQIKNGNYSNLNEAIINVLDEGFGSRDILENEYRIYSYNQNLSFEVDSFASQPYDYTGRNKIVPGAKMRNDGGNEFITLRMHDAIRNYGLESFSFIDSLSTHFIEKHEFQIIRETYHDREVVYEIDLSYEDPFYLAEGRIFINAADFAIHKLDYALTKRSRQPPPVRNITNSKERYTDGFKKTSRERMYRIQIEYARGPANKMFLNYISFYNKVLLQRPAEFFTKMVIHLPDSSLRFYVNRKPANLDRIKTSDFRIRYRTEQVPLEEFYFIDRENTFVVCPHLGYKKAKETIEALFTANYKNTQVSGVNYSFGDIKDAEGNKLDERRWEYLHQYREFFTQEIGLGGTGASHATGLMLKDQPLGSSQQPLHEDNLKQVYWKNTPLPVLKTKASREDPGPVGFPDKSYSTGE